MSTYDEFLRAKMALAPSTGLAVADADIHPLLKPHQRDMVRWAVEGQPAAHQPVARGYCGIRLLRAPAGGLLRAAPDIELLAPPVPEELRNVNTPEEREAATQELRAG